jgi:hypothetical protein
MELLEKLVSVVAVIVIVLVAALVGIFSFVIQQSSGISHEEEVAAIAVDDWLTDARRAAGGQGPASRVLLMANAPSPMGGVTATPNGQKPNTAAPKPAQPGHPDNYIANEGEQIPVNEQVPGVPWLRRQEGVTYMRPESVPQVVAERYKGFDEAWQAAQQGAGEFVDGKYKINWVDPNSLLATKVGLQPGDQIESVNGRPVGNTFAANRQLYDSLKGSKQFAVKVLRNGQEVVLSFFVN